MEATEPFGGWANNFRGANPKGSEAQSFSRIGRQSRRSRMRENKLNERSTPSVQDNRGMFLCNDEQTDNPNGGRTSMSGGQVSRL